MSLEENRALIRAHIADINTCDPEIAARSYSSDAINHAAPGSPREGKEGFQRTFAELFTIFPDWHFAIEELVAEGDTVMCHTLLTGTHQGTPTTPVLGGMLLGLPPTGKRVSVPHVHIFKIRDGEIAEHGAVRHDLVMMRQLGVIPPPGRPA